MVSWFKKIRQLLGLRKPVLAKTERESYIAELEAADAPWAVFEVAGFEADGRIKVMFNWNSSFIKKINELGFQAETEEDSVQLFFYASQMKPTELAAGDPAVQSLENPTLSSPQNTLKV